MSTPRRVTALRGRVTRGAYGTGSKSEREAVFLDADEPVARYVLRRKTGPVFGDAELERFVGHRVQCEGFVVDGTLLAERIEIVT